MANGARHNLQVTLPATAPRAVQYVAAPKGGSGKPTERAAARTR